VILIIGIAAVIWLKTSTYSGMRAFQLSSDDMSSLTVKFNGIKWYFQTSNPLYWITGSLGSTSVTGIDSEFGHIYTWYGLFGVYWYFKYYRIIANQNSQLRFYSRIIVVTMLLTAMTASVLLAMQIFTFACVLAFAEITTESNYIRTEILNQKRYSFFRY
jgi:hypothetical protein